MRRRKWLKSIMCFILVFGMLSSELSPVMAAELGAEITTEQEEDEKVTKDDSINNLAEEEGTQEDAPIEAAPETSAEETPADAAEGETVPEEENVSEEVTSETPEEGENQGEDTGTGEEEIPEEATPETLAEEDVEEQLTEDELSEENEQTAQNDPEDSDETTEEESLVMEFTDALLPASASYSQAVELADSTTSNVEELEISKTAYRRNSSEDDDVYKMTLTAKAPKPEVSALVVLDGSGSMKSDYDSTDISGEKNSRIYKEANTVLHIQDILRGYKNSSELGLVGFYSWAGKTPYSKDTIDPGNYHGYEYPLYLSFEEWKTQNISYGKRAQADGVDATFNEIYFPNGVYDSDGNEGSTVPATIRSVIPDYGSLLNTKIDLIDSKGNIQSSWSDQEMDPEDDTSNTYDLFYNTNWEVALREAAEMLETANGDNDQILLFITDGVPQTFEYNNRMAEANDMKTWGDSIWGESETQAKEKLESFGFDSSVVDATYEALKQYNENRTSTDYHPWNTTISNLYIELCAAQTIDEYNAIKKINPDVKIVSVLIGPAAREGSDNATPYLETLQYPTYGKKLEDSLNARSVVVSDINGDMILNGSDEAVLDIIEGIASRMESGC